LHNGRKESEEKKSIEIATNLLKCGCDIEFVHENTKLSIEQITKLKEVME